MNTEIQSKFNFFQHWYPLSPIQDIDPKQPTSVTILGLRLVIWKPKSSKTYQVFLDQCPHRLAPLSEGRVPVFLTSFRRLMEQRSGGAEGKEQGTLIELSPAPLLLCTPAQAQALRGVVRNPGC